MNNPGRQSATKKLAAKERGEAKRFARIQTATS
jgi:hypothetical protein